MRIGVDLDNTIIRYDEVFSAGAARGGYVDNGWHGTKADVRTIVRAVPDGERKWQALQGWAYGKGLDYAVPFEGVRDALQAMARVSHSLFIVSHKTRFGHFDENRVDLRVAAMAWLEAQGIISPNGPVTVEQVFFEDTREAKVARIAHLGFDVFIDDLIEVFETPGFPGTTRRILFGEAPAGFRWPAFDNWPAITAEVLR